MLSLYVRRPPALSRRHPPFYFVQSFNKTKQLSFTSKDALSNSWSRRQMSKHSLSLSHTCARIIREAIDRWAGRPIGRPPSSPHPPAPQGLTVLFCKQQEPSIDRANHWRQGLSLSSPSLSHTHARRVIDTQWQQIYAVPPPPPPCLAFLLSLSQLKRQGGG